MKINKISKSPSVFMELASKGAYEEKSSKEFLVSSITTSRGCLGTVVDWIQSVFTAIFHFVTCKYFYTASEARIGDADNADDLANQKESVSSELPSEEHLVKSPTKNMFEDKKEESSPTSNELQLKKEAKEDEPNLFIQKGIENKTEENASSTQKEQKSGENGSISALDSLLKVQDTVNLILIKLDIVSLSKFARLNKRCKQIFDAEKLWKLLLVGHFSWTLKDLDTHVPEGGPLTYKQGYKQALEESTPTIKATTEKEASEKINLKLLNFLCRPKWNVIRTVSFTDKLAYSAGQFIGPEPFLGIYDQNKIRNERKYSVICSEKQLMTDDGMTSGTLKKQFGNGVFVSYRDAPAFFFNAQSLFGLIDFDVGTEATLGYRSEMNHWGEPFPLIRVLDENQKEVWAGVFPENKNIKFVKIYKNGKILLESKKYPRKVYYSINAKSGLIDFEAILRSDPIRFIESSVPTS